MTETIFNGRHNPCKGCKDRYPACSAHCQKPEFLAWQEEQDKIREARRNYLPPRWKYPEPVIKHKYGAKRKRN